MPYKKQNIPGFEGLSMVPRPEDIRDTQASDMLNLRFDKLGYLVNRNGVRAFEFIHVSTPEAPDITKVSGATAIGEYILSAPVDDTVAFDPRANGVDAHVVNTSHSYPLDSYDRFMVYGFRNEAVDAPTQPQLTYALVPNSQMPDSVSSFVIDNDYSNQPQDDGDVVFFHRPEWAGTSINRRNNPPDLLLAAPRRIAWRVWVNETTGLVDDENWIDHYGRMAQYANSLVIADRVNGDMIIHDEWDEAETGATKAHKLRLQQNVKMFFDVDIVKIDPQLNTGEKNGAGVEHSMALYKFYAKKKQAAYTNDGYRKTVYEDYIGKDIRNLSLGGLTGYIYPKNFEGPMLQGFCLFADGGANGLDKGLWRNTSSQTYTFSDYREPAEIDSILDPVSFDNPDLPRQYDEKGNRINNNAADVFIWDDVKLTYYPCSGVDDGALFLRAKDREWAKKNSITPKIVRLTPRSGIEQEIPLAVWAYQFVIQLEDGSYSVASAPLLIPDKLWSAERDADASWRIRYFDNEQERTHFGDYTTYEELNTASGMGESLTFTPGLESTNYEAIHRKIKSALYESGHLFSGTVADADCSVLATMYHPDDNKQLDGIILSGVNFVTIGPETQVHDTHQAKLIVPLVKRMSDPLTYNSVFTDTSDAPGAAGGYLRTAIQDRTLGKQAVFYDLAFGGSANVLPGSYGLDRDIDVIRYHKDVYFNLVAHKDDENNFNEAAHPEYRIPTMLRFVQKQKNRLAYVSSSANAEAVDRILATGIAELQLADFEHWGVCRSQYDFYDPDDGYLAYDKVRSAGSPTGLKDARRNLAIYDEGTLFVPDMSYYQQVLSGGSYVNAVSVRDWYINADGGIGSQRWAYWSSDLGVSIITDNPFITTYPKDLVTNLGDDDNAARWYRINNMRVVVHLPAERLLIPEQLSAYFPSSLLFNAPRMMLRIDKEDLPVKAKRILVFRTLATHDNDWVPSKFGLAKDIKLERDDNGDLVDFEYFDEVKDSELDFTTQTDEFDGIIYPLQSAFVRPLKERMWYANFKETYQPYAPRGFVTNDETIATDPLVPGAGYLFGKDASWKELVVTDNAANRAKGFTTDLNGKYHQYFIIFKDLSGEYSEPKYLNDGSGTISSVDYTATTDLSAVALMLAGYPYTAAIDSCEVYRRSFTTISGMLSTPYFYKIGEIKPEDEGVFVDNGLPNLVDKWTQYGDSPDYLPISARRVDNMESQLAWSESYDPSWIKYESRRGFRDGDGDQITGLEVIYSELILFKEHSIHRITLKNDSNEIARVEEVANNYGCIAPNTIVQYNNCVYFLSWLGFMKYDNNGVVKADGEFGYELDQRLKETFMNTRNPAIRDASVAINSAHHEMYLNIPAYGGTAAYNYHQEGIKGHIYVINLDYLEGLNKNDSEGADSRHLVTKFQYETGDYERFVPGQNEGNTSSGTNPHSMARLYYHNSLGQLHSAEILPKTPDVRSLFHIESPTDIDYDMYQPGIKADGTPEDTDQILTEPVHSWRRSKMFTMEDNSIVKRVRQVAAYFGLGTNIRIGVEFNNQEYLRDAYTESQFGQSGELTLRLPRHMAGYDRGERFAVHLASEGETEIQNLSFHWRPVNTWAR